jgi:hypothetical protein
MRLYFAGGEAWADLLLDMGVKNILFSFFYFRGMLRSDSGKARTLLARMRLAQSKGYSFFLDSGAFTYQERARLQVGSVPPPERYWEEYKRFVFDYGDIFDQIAELDIDFYGVKDSDGNTVDTRRVDDWTNELLSEPGIQYRVVPCYHLHRGEKWLKDWLIDTRSPLIALGSAAAITSSGGGAASIIHLCHRFGKAVHGFAQTQIKTTLKLTPYDSVDSTTWLRADKYGGTCIFINDQFIVLDHLHKADRAKYRTYFESLGLDFKKVMEDDLETMRLATISAWRDLALSYERKFHFLGGKPPYLVQLLKEHGRLPGVHPMVTKLRREKEQTS